jgi:PPOX class probable F420-dependent enzyme
MTVADRVAHASNRLYDAVRSSRARAAAEQGGESADLRSLEGHKYCLLTTYKRSGEPVPTPVWFGLAGGRLYFRTYADAAKVKRLRRSPRVLVGACDVRGNPKGPMLEATARVVPKEQEERAEAAIRSNYGLFRRVYEASFAMRVDGVYVEVAPT